MYQYCIYPKEIAVILGKSNSYASSLVRTMKDAYNIRSQRTVTIKEFCDFMDLPYEDVFAMINGGASKSTSKSA